MEFNIKSNKEIKHDACYLSRVENDTIKLVGYSSDDLPKPPDFPMTYKERVIYNGNMNSNRFGKPIKSKKEKREEKRKGLFSKTEPLELNEWFVYKIDGEKWYYKFAQDLNVLKMHHKAEFLGIGRPNSVPHIKINHNELISNDTNVIKDKIINTIKIDRYTGKICCYCEVPLSNKNGTREHVMPKHKGGKMIKSACRDCNTEKGGLMLHSYIQMLNLQLLDVTGQDLIKLQTKIKNANALAKELENSIDKK